MAVELNEPRSKLWTLGEYYQLAEDGWFQGQRVQLIEGEIIQMPPQGHAHAKSLMQISRWLYETFKDEYLVRIQMPLNLLQDSDPEPDAAVIRGPLAQYHDHPQSALLVIEVADSSLQLDRRKAEMYAAAAIPEYWIVNLGERCVEIYRNPKADAKSASGLAYSARTVVHENDSISSLLAPSTRVKIVDLLP